MLDSWCYLRLFLLLFPHQVPQCWIVKSNLTRVSGCNGDWGSLWLIKSLCVMPQQNGRLHGLTNCKMPICSQFTMTYLRFSLWFASLPQGPVLLLIASLFTSKLIASERRVLPYGGGLLDIIRIFTSSHPHYHMFTSSHPHIFAYSHLHIFTSSQTHIFTSFVALSLSLFSFLSSHRSSHRPQAGRRGATTWPWYARNEARVSKTEGLCAVQLLYVNAFVCNVWKSIVCKGLCV